MSPELDLSFAYMSGGDILEFHAGLSKGKRYAKAFFMEDPSA